MLGLAVVITCKPELWTDKIINFRVNGSSETLQLGQLDCNRSSCSTSSVDEQWKRLFRRLIWEGQFERLIQSLFVDQIRIPISKLPAV